MSWRRSLLVLLALVAVLPASPADALTRGPQRIAGADRYQTSVDLSVAAFPDGADTAVLASGVAFPDGLAAGPLAALKDGPVLLTPAEGLPPQVGGELKRLGVEEVLVVGGTAAVWDDVLRQVTEATGVTPRRIAGETRYATAALVAAEFPAGPAAAYVASGTTFPDALAGGAAAARVDAPLLLTAPDALPDVVGLALARLGPAEIRVLGGAAAVGEPVVQRLAAFKPTRRISGSDRYGTAAALAAEAGSTDEVLLTSGRAFPDALAAAGLAAEREAPILLAEPSCAPQPTLDRVRDAGWPDITVIGGTTAVGGLVSSVYPCTKVADGLLAPGVTLTTQTLPGPRVVHILTLDRRQGYEVRPTMATGRLRGRLATTDVARRWGALAAVNAGFFLDDGRPAHAYAERGRLLKYPGTINTVVGFDPDKQDYGLFARPEATVTFRSSVGDHPIAEVNEGLPEGEGLALLTPESANVDVPIEGSWCRAVLSSQGSPSIDSTEDTVLPYGVSSAGCSSAPLPRGSDVLLAREGTAAGTLLSDLAPGESVSVRWRMHPTARGVTDVVGGNVTLVFGGRVADEVLQGQGEFFSVRAPRTAIGQRPNGDLVIVTVDGRQPGYSIGMTARELADFMVGLGTIDAANLDGGGSTAMAVRGVLVNRPSEPSGERAVGSALVIVPKGHTAPPPTGSASAGNTDPDLDSASLGGFQAARRG